MIIRQEQPADYNEVYELVKRSFATSTNEGEWDYLNEVRKKDTFIPELSLVAENDDGKLIGLAPTDETRINFIMPYMLRLLRDVSGKRILDLGCGEGGYSRELTRRNADVVAVDCTEFSIEYAKKQSLKDGFDIKYYIRNSNDLYDIEDNGFDIVLCSMMLMDCEDLNGTIKEIARVLKPSGKLFASALHPCFTGKNIGREGEGINRKVIVEDYFNPTEYEQPLPNGKISVIWRHRTLEEYVKFFVKHGLTIVDLNEARPSTEQSEISVALAWLQKIPLFLFWELKK